MKRKTRIIPAVLLGAIAAGPVLANEQLATDSGCMACHKVDTKVLGPSYKEIAAKYKGDEGAEAMLVEKVKKGGVGTWGQVPMPPNSPRVSDEDITTLVQWILAM
jgi:cytochrome c